MRGRRILVALAAATVVALGGSALAQIPPAEEPPAIEARGVIVPSIVLFGDTVRARVDVTLDRERVDVDSVRVAADFQIWEVVGDPERSRRDAGSTTYLRTTYVLRCLTSPCIPNNFSLPTEFDPARVSYEQLGGETRERESVRVQWPVVLLYSRFAITLSEGTGGSTIPWRADLVSMPDVSYRVAPGFVLAFLLTAAGLFAVAALALAYVAWPRRAPPPPEPEPEPEPEPQVLLTPLEQALALLEDPVRLNGAADQRRALELVAEELEDRGERDIARAARTLAWSEEVPRVEVTSGLAARVREAIGDVEEETEEGDDAALD
ncbi:MAG TPA: hypothetical protein VI503_06045 [Gaiellaceae bacterium]|nr:hypothetical protein [Gaiellaceae bacterium]HLF68890.1 hypothetical protein [Gaiellaceae bacterium]